MLRKMFSKAVSAVHRDHVIGAATCVVMGAACTATVGGLQYLSMGQTVSNPFLIAAFAGISGLMMGPTYNTVARESNADGVNYPGIGQTAATESEDRRMTGAIAASAALMTGGLGGGCIAAMANGVTLFMRAAPL